MRKHLVFVIVIFICGSILMACSDDDNATNNQNNEEDTAANDQEDNQNDNNENEDFRGNNDDSQNDSNNSTNNNDSDSPVGFEPDEEDQEGLDIGDTGKFDTTLGSYEMTLDEAKLVGSELDGETSNRDDLIVLDITIKNTSDEKQKMDELIESMEVTLDEEMSGSSDASNFFDSIDGLEGELDPGEEKSGQFITDVNKSNEFYFMKSQGFISGGSSNQVIWEFEPKEE